jgi:GNAT superfamily N-acetyltransferase
MQSPSQPHAQGLRDVLMKMPGVRVRHIDNVTFVGEVEDQVKWNDRLEELIPLFGRILCDEYCDSMYEPDSPLIREEILRQLRISFANTKYVYVFEKGEEVAGFASVQCHTQDLEVGIIRDILVQAQFRRQGFGRRLYELLYTDCPFRAIIGSTSHPGAAVTRLHVARQHGCDAFFGSMGCEREDLSHYREMVVAYLRQEDMLIDDKLPCGYVLVRQEVAPPFGEQMSSLENSDLRRAFEELQKLQELYPQGTVEGILITVRSRKNDAS